jgi:hypothetical protein
LSLDRSSSTFTREIHFSCYYQDRASQQISGSQQDLLWSRERSVHTVSALQTA